MARQGLGGQSFLAFPYLGEDVVLADRRKRDYEIEEEVASYIEAIAAAAPIFERLGTLPPNMPLPKIPEKPEILTELERAEKWGLGSRWQDVPYEYFLDLEAADRGRGNGRRHIRQDAAATTPALPPMKPMLSR